MTTLLTTVSSSQGVVSTKDDSNTSKGFIIGKELANKGFSPFLLFTTARSASFTVTGSDPGLTNMSSSDGTVVTGTLPNPNTVPGALFIFRGDNNGVAHVITCSAVTRGIQDTSTAGSKLALSASQTAAATNLYGAVALLSTGTTYLVWATSSGSYTISG